MAGAIVSNEFARAHAQFEGNRTSAFQELLKDAALQEEFAFLREPPRGKAWLGHLGFRIFGTLLFNFWCPLRTHGRDKLPEPPFILCSNHSSHMDSAALMYARLGFNQFGMVAAQDYFFENKKRKNSLPLLMNLIPADRKSNRPKHRAADGRLPRISSAGQPGDHHLPGRPGRWTARSRSLKKARR